MSRQSTKTSTSGDTTSPRPRTQQRVLPKTAITRSEALSAAGRLQAARNAFTEFNAVRLRDAWSLTSHSGRGSVCGGH